MFQSEHDVFAHISPGTVSHNTKDTHRRRYWVSYLLRGHTPRPQLSKVLALPEAPVRIEPWWSIEVSWHFCLIPLTVPALLCGAATGPGITEIPTSPIFLLASYMIPKVKQPVIQVFWNKIQISHAVASGLKRHVVARVFFLCSVHYTTSNSDITTSWQARKWHPDEQDLTYHKSSRPMLC